MFYCEDVGLRNVRLNFREFEDAHLMENVIEQRGWFIPDAEDEFLTVSVTVKDGEAPVSCVRENETALY